MPALAALPYHRITVVDEQTSRGVPWVELKATDADELWTDSAGVVAFYRADLMNTWVYFTVRSYGYTVTPDAEGNPGVKIFTAAGGSTTITLHRVNLAERLYRITGADIYADSVLLGDTVPPTQDPAAYRVIGQDSTDAAVFKNKIHWYWGDTGMQNYILGNFKVTGAVSDLPGMGGLDPETGVYLTYFRNPNGTVKSMANMTYSGLIWFGGFVVTKDGSNNDHLVTGYVKVLSGFVVTERGLVQFNETTNVYDFLCLFPMDSVILPGGNTIKYTKNGTDYIYYCNPYANVRVADSFEAIQDLANYEAFSCLIPGSVYDGTAGQLERDTQGNLVWGWKAATSPINETQTRELIQKGFIQPDEDCYRVTDINTGDGMYSHAGTVRWNEYRKRWTSIRSQLFGQSILGEIWYLEADTPLGPWVYAQKVVTDYRQNNSYTCYNPIQHTFFDKEGGRKIFFEGTVTTFITDVDHPTPQYNYNQMMYKLDLGDPALFLPVPVYRVQDTIPYYATKTDIPDETTSRSVVCFAPDRQRANTIPIYAYTDTPHGTTILTDSNTSGPAPIAFYAVDRGATLPPGTDLALTVPLNEFVHATTGDHIYTTKDTVEPPGYTKSLQPVCRVWPNPVKFNPYDLPN